MILNSTAESLNPNPILVAFRTEVRLQREADWLSMQSVAELTLARQDGFEDATPDQIDHARRVLTRLANFNTNGKSA